MLPVINENIFVLLFSLCIYTLVWSHSVHIPHLSAHIWDTSVNWQDLGIIYFHPKAY